MNTVLAHHHLLSVVHSELPKNERRTTILDVGCGDGRLMAVLDRILRKYRPELEVAVHGFDVSDSRVQVAGFMHEANEYLARSIPEVDWSGRLQMIESRSPWPYEDATFDWVVSNHVIEHVADPELFFHEIARVLRPGGKSVHLFPVLENVQEGHVHIPGAHWIRDHDRLRGYLRFMSALGIGNFQQQRREDPSLDLAKFAETRADYLTYFTNYMTKSRVLELAKRFRLRASFRYTEHFYFNKLRMLLRRAPRHDVRPWNVPVLHGLLMSLCSRVSSITLFLENRQSYREP